MATRGAWGFITPTGEEKIRYNHYDSYPTWLGAGMLKMIRDFHNDLARFAHEIKFVDPSQKLDPSILRNPPKPYQKRRELYEKTISNNEMETWYFFLESLSPHEQLAYWIPAFDDSRKFLKDSLFCEWAYVVNLKTEKLEIYRGFNTNPKSPGRYAKYTADGRYSHRGSKVYYGVRLLLEIPFNQICCMTDEEIDAFCEGLDVINDVFGSKFGLPGKPWSSKKIRASLRKVVAEVHRRLLADTNGAAISELDQWLPVIHVALRSAYQNRANPPKIEKKAVTFPPTMLPPQVTDCWIQVFWNLAGPEKRVNLKIEDIIEVGRAIKFLKKVSDFRAKVFRRQELIYGLLSWVQQSAISLALAPDSQRSRFVKWSFENGIINVWLGEQGELVFVKNTPLALLTK